MKPILPALALTGLLLFTGCGIAADPPVAVADAAEVAAEAIALHQVGSEVPVGTSAAGDAPGRPALRRQLRANTLHGEVVVQTKAGPKTVVVQRGEVTAVSAIGLTVRSADGFTLTWTFGDPLRVVQDRRPAERSAVRTGGQVGVAGSKEGDLSRARLIVAG